MVIVPILSLSGIFYLNYCYKKLWDEIDPPKPKDEKKLTKSEVLLINKCDENFDKWATKYEDIAERVRMAVVFFNHKIFLFPFTHFFGYKHFTLRTQDYFVKWTWNPKDCKKF